MRRLHASSAVKPVSSAPDLRPGRSEAFRDERGETFSSDHPLAKTVLVSLAAAWPGAVAFSDLEAEETAEGRLELAVDGAPVEPGCRRVLEALLDHHLRKMAEHALLIGT